MNLLSKPLPVLLLCCLVMAVFWLAPQARSEVLINEILGDPSSDWDGDGAFNYRDDEWIEVINTGPAAENLEDYWLRDTTGDDLHLQLSGSLEAGQVAVFYGSEASAWQREQGNTVVGLSINNAGDTLELLQTVSGPGGASLEVVHSVTVTDHEADDDRSGGTDPDTGEWVLYDALNPYNGAAVPQGNDCEPTPGMPNSCAPLVPTDTTTWDAVKSQYR